MTNKKLMSGYGVFDYFIDLIDECPDITSEKFPLLASHKNDKGRKKGSVIAKLLPGVNQRKIVIFLVRLDYYIHLWNNDFPETKDRGLYEFSFNVFPELKELFTELEVALAEKEVIIKDEGTVARKKARKKGTDMEVIESCHEKVKALQKTSSKMAGLFQTFYTQLAEVEVAMKDTKMALGSITTKKQSEAQVSEAVLVGLLQKIAEKGDIILKTPDKPDDTGADDKDEE